MKVTHYAVVEIINLSINVATPLMRFNESNLNLEPLSMGLIISFIISFEISPTIFPFSTHSLSILLTMILVWRMSWISSWSRVINDTQNFRSQG